MNRNLKHFAILEVGDSESPMIGVINNITNNTQGIDSFIHRALKALSDHFDVDDVAIDVLPDLFDGDSSWTTTISTEYGEKFNIEISETWIY